MKTLEYTKKKYCKKKFKMPTICVNGINYYVWGVPFIPFFKLYGFIDKKTWQMMKWNYKKANKILDYVIPYVFSYDKPDDSFYALVDKYSYWSVENRIYRKCKIRHKLWVSKFRMDILHYLENCYEYEGYNKEIDDGYGERYIVFRKAEV